MTERSKVFKCKVLQKLYALPPKILKAPPETVEAVSCVKAQAVVVPGDRGEPPVQPNRRVYTVLPPPDDYRTGGDESVTQPESNINTEGAPAVLPDEDGPERRGGGRRRKRKRGGGPAAEDDGGERLGKNKRRKLKKKRHKEKLLSLGLAPRAAAVEFSFRQGEEEEEDTKARQKRAAEVTDFLKTTQEIYLSDRSSPACVPHVPHLALEALLTRLSSGTAPSADVTQLHTLKSLVLRRDTEKLTKTLEEFQCCTTLPPDEVLAICSLFRYWIMDILPSKTDDRSNQQRAQPP